jgi:hypothetical protein
MGEGEGHHLPGIGGVGHDLLIAGHGGVEAQLAYRCAGGAESLAEEQRPIGQRDATRRPSVQRPRSEDIRLFWQDY